LLFPSEEWVQAWVERANASAEFEASGAGWDGVVGAVIEADPASGFGETVCIRLEGRNGKWLRHSYGRDLTQLEGATFVLRAPYARWKQIVRQELSPVKALFQGKLRIQGHLPTILRWVDSLLILTRIAGELETRFADESPERPGAAELGHGA
jgi:putative sterol carrier protein